MHAAIGLSEQQITSVPVAIEWLRQVANRNFDEELEYLNRLKESSEVLEVYQQLFPGQFSASDASLFEPDHEWSKYTAREGEFLRLLRRLEWLPIQQADEWEMFEERYNGIPVISLQGGEWCCGGYEVDQLTPGYHLGFCVLNEHWEGAVERYGLKESDLDFVGPVDFRLFDERLSRERDALRYLPATTDLMSYATGNPFLDASCCNWPNYYPWTAKNVRWLATEYKRANYLLRAVWELDDLVEADPGKVFLRVRDLWNQSLKKQ